MHTHAISQIKIKVNVPHDFQGFYTEEMNCSFNVLDRPGSGGAAKDGLASPRPAGNTSARAKALAYNATLASLRA